ncbi:ATPase, V1 complex, subunit C [Polychytrium aggregatum]|uniref:ATPase, V1 complex, subunit C n=1 Tax=Polychytrium aggregatum TaxID=110093 RepID=UPI0022FDDBFA|nr:ATPase, V1 complex, subunit C [Polychytrium aggregatum]KAI9193600.1 ATPase, V1 complex, subunit C [Polychytrium aggregatum]
MSENSGTFYIVSAPADPKKIDAVNKLKAKIASRGGDYAEVFAVNLPEFKVGTLDTLVVLSDDLSKLDSNFESIACKLSDNMKSLLNNDVEQWRSNLSVTDKSIDNYLRGFQWNAMKYRTDKSLRELTDLITQEVTSIDTLMKNKMQNYATVKGQLQGLQRKQVGNLSVRSLNDVVKKEHFVLDSEYLTTLLVAVPKQSERDWLNNYESLTQMVVPRSTQKITEDDEYIIYTVTLFKRIVDDYTLKAREFKFIVRDFKWDESQMAKDKKELAEIGASEKGLWSQVLRLCKTNFGEVYASWLHIKVIRACVESVLRYGLPPDFQVMIVKAKPKQDRKVRDLINQLYSNLGGAANSKGSIDEHVEENLQLLLGDKDYSPVVLFPVNAIV